MIKTEKFSMELSQKEIKRIFEYFDEGIDDWMEYHRKNPGTYEFDAKLKARFQNALYMIEGVGD